MNTNVYFRNSEGKLGKFAVADVTGPDEAVQQVAEALAASGEEFKRPLLAVIEGGKK